MTTPLPYSIIVTFNGGPAVWDRYATLEEAQAALAEDVQDFDLQDAHIVVR